jgi:tetratricopeptide (TPR) repeat protein
LANSALIDDLERQFAENPRRVFARLANEYRKSGDFQRAIEICQVHVPQQPGYISGYIVMGQALFESGRLDEAQATFQTALDLDPENLIALRHLGDIARETGELNGARIWYQRLLEIDPQNEEIAAQLAQLAEAGADATAADAPEPTAGWSEINPEQGTSTTVDADAEPAMESVSGLSASYVDTPPSAEHIEVPQFEIAGSDMLAEHEPLDLREEAAVLDAHLSAAVEPATESESPYSAPAELPDVHDDFAARDIIPETDPFAAPDDIGPPSISDLQFGGDEVVELASLDEHPALAHEMPAAPEPASLEEEEVPAAAAADGDDSTHAAFVTETMAEVYLEQGHRHEAMQIFQHLAEQDRQPGDFRERDEPLDQSDEGATVGDSEPVTAAAPTRARPERTIRNFLAALAERRPPRPTTPRDVEVPAWGQGGAEATEPSVSPHEEAAAHSLAAAFSEDYLSRRAGVVPPPRVASNELSLDQVFRQPRGAPDGQSARAVSFDEFFSPRSGDASAQGEGKEGDQSEQAKPSSDLELFHAWLEGLKK